MHDLHTKCEPLHRVLESKCRVEDHGILLVDAAELDEVDEAIRITVVGRPIRFSPLCAGGSGQGDRQGDNLRIEPLQHFVEITRK